MDSSDIKSSEIYVLDRKKIRINGIKKLVSFDNNEFVMDTVLGPLVLRGKQLEIVKLDVISGLLDIKGIFNSLIYLDSKDNKKKEESFLTKLFK